MTTERDDEKGDQDAAKDPHVDAETLSDLDPKGEDDDVKGGAPPSVSWKA